ncbi:MAG: CotH kinase family protein [Bacillota bacterium]
MSIPIYNLNLEPLDLKELQRDVWIDDPVPAKLLIQREKLDVDIAYRGSHIREFKKKSYHVGFYHPPTYQGAREIHLNAEYKDPSFIRNKLSLDFFSEIGCLSPTSRHVFLNLNGKAEGIYLELESVDKQFLVKRNLPLGAIFYAVNGDGNFSLLSAIDKKAKASLISGYERKYGNQKTELYLEEMIVKINTLSRADFKREIVRILDVEKYLHWLAGGVLTQNYDGFVHNYALYRNGAAGRFELIPWDYDATWGRDVHGRLLAHDFVPINGFNTLTARILDVDSFRSRYQQILVELINASFTLEQMNPKVERLANNLRPYVLKDPYKKHAIEQFDREPTVIAEFIEKRRRFIKEQLYKLN